MASRKIKLTDRVQYSYTPYHELLIVADNVAREKGIDKEEVLIAMEQAIQKASRAKYGIDHDIRAFINRTSGEVSITKCLTVVEEVENPLTQISFKEAVKRFPNIKIDEIIRDSLPPIEFCRVSAQGARQIIVQRVKEAERARQYEDFKDRTGQIINGLIKRIEFGSVIVDLGKAEGILRKEDIIPRETFRMGDRIRAYIIDIKPEAKGPIVILSRTHIKFMMKLFEQEIPEIYDNIIEIKSVARDPGSRAKIAVLSTDPSVDPVGACVGIRGSRVQSVMNELRGERIDVILWSSNPATFIVNALAPAEVIKVIIDEEVKRVDVIVSEDQLSLAIGKRGQNVRLASQLTGWNIDILTESEESSKRTEEYLFRSKLFMKALDVDEIIAQLLSAEGFCNIKELAESSIDELLQIEGFDEELAKEIFIRAKNYIVKEGEDFLMQCKSNGASEELLSFNSLLTTDMLLQLIKNGIRTLEDLADLSSEELCEILIDYNLSKELSNKVIIKAREHWFK